MAAFNSDDERVLEDGEAVSSYLLTPGTGGRKPTTSIVLGPNVMLPFAIPAPASMDPMSASPPPADSLFFDPSTASFVCVTSTSMVQRFPAPPSLYNIPLSDPPLEPSIQLKARGAVWLCPRFSPDSQFVAVVRSAIEVEVVRCSDGKPFSVTCKASRPPPQILDCVWTSTTNLLVVTNQNVELYQFVAAKLSFKLLKYYTATSFWFLYSRETGVAVCAANPTGTVLQPFRFTPSEPIARLPRLQLTVVSPLHIVAASDVALVTIYSALYLAFTNSEEGTLSLYPVTAAEGASRLANLPIERRDRHAISVIDNMLVAHNLDRRTSRLFDPRVSTKTAVGDDVCIQTAGLPPPIPFPGTASADSAGAAASAAAAGALPDSFYSEAFEFFPPNLALHRPSRRVFSLALVLESLASHFPERKRRLAFLIKRDHSKAHLLHLLRDLVYARSDPAFVGLIFDMVNEVCALADDERAAAERAAVDRASAAAQARRKSWFNFGGGSSSSAAATAAAMTSASAGGGAAAMAADGAVVPETYAAMLAAKGGLRRSPYRRPTAAYACAVIDFVARHSANELDVPAETEAATSSAGASAAGSAAGSAPSTPTAVTPRNKGTAGKGTALAVAAAAAAAAGSARAEAAAAASAAAAPHVLDGIITERTVEGYAVLEQVDLYTWVLVPVEETRGLPPRYKLAVLTEYVRSLNFHHRPVQHYLHEQIIRLLVSEGQFFKLHQLIQFHVVRDSEHVALQLLSLDAVYPPAFQMALDMLKRLQMHDQIIEVLLSRGMVLPALRLVRDHSPRVVSAKPFLQIALDAEDTALFFTAFTFFQQRNLALHGTQDFAPEDGCAAFVAKFNELFAPAQQRGS